MFRITSWIGLLAGVIFFEPLLAADVTLQDNDRVALIGNTFVERAQRFGHLETAMLIASPAKNLKFRNLGWSGDSVFNDARSYFGPPKEGRDRLGKAIRELEPTVIFLCYGTGAAMSVGRKWTDEKNLPKSENAEQPDLSLFQYGYEMLLKNIREAGGEKLREIVLVTPPPLENLGTPLPNQIQNNKNLKVYSEAISKLAAKNGFQVINLFGSMGWAERVASPALTENGVHYSDTGYQIVADHWIKQMGLTPRKETDQNRVAIQKLRSEVIEKNRLFFHRWRPANETYLFLFRKHEQGQNAKEIPMFDPLIEKREAAIEKLRLEILQTSKPA